VIQLIDLSQDEPDPSLFQVPSDFVIEDLRTSAKTGN
jgi:hypothetical protein